MDQRGSDFPFRRSGVADPSHNNDSSFEEMRQQLMDPFFDQPRSSWGDVVGGPDSRFFSRHGFDGGIPQSRIDNMGSFPRDSIHMRGFPEQPMHMAGFPDDSMHIKGFPHSPQFQQSNEPKQSDATSNRHRIPIKIVNESDERKSPNSKTFVGGRYTTELPARNSPQGSPRLERAHSEPPKVLNQRLFNAGRPNYSTIPEGIGDLHIRHSRPANLSVPDGTANNLSTSASVPSVPHFQNSAPTATGIMPQGIQPQIVGNQESRKSTTTPGNVRHIPIFVEGRSEPVISKGSDFTGRPRPSERCEGNRIHIQMPPQQVPPQQVPPPAPFPMGWSRKEISTPEKQQQEPTSPPLLVHDGPIPLPCSPNLYKTNASTPDNSTKVVPTEQNPIIDNPEEQQKKSSSSSPPSSQETSCNINEVLSAEENVALKKIQKVKADIADISEHIASFEGDKKKKEYLILEERLMRNLLLLDSVETHGQEDLRSLRKESIKSVNRCLSLLDSRTKIGTGAMPEDGAEQKQAEANNDIVDLLAEKSK